MNSEANKPCTCQSGKSFKICCDRFLNQGQHAKAPVQLMRSRYTAFALGGYGDYLLATWKLRPAGASAADLSVRSTQWTGLEIVGKSQKGDAGYVEFKASFIGSAGEAGVHHEKSEFERVNGRWLYVSGDVK